MTYGEILAQTYDLPRREAVQQTTRGRGAQVAARTGGQEPAFNFADFGLGTPPAGLQYDRPDLAQKSQQIMQEWADLRKFAKNMWVNHRVNVLAPDPGNPDAVYASQAFNQRLGTLMVDIDKAKVGGERAKYAYEQNLAGNVIMQPTATQEGTGYFSEQLPQNIGLSTKLDPMIDLAARTLSGEYWTDVNKRNQKIDNLKEALKVKYSNDPRALAIQLSAADELIASVRPRDPDSSGSGTNLLPTAFGLTEYAKLALGSPEYYKLPDKPKYTREGRPLYEATPPGWLNMNIGVKKEGPNKNKPFTVARILFDYGDPSKTGDETAYFEDAEGERLSINKDNLIPGFNAIMDSNRGMYSRKELNDYLTSQRFGSDVVPAYKILDLNSLMEIQAAQQQGKQVVGQISPSVKASFDNYMAELDKLTPKKRVFTAPVATGGRPFTLPSWVPGSETSEKNVVEIPLINGKIAKIKQTETGVYRIDNWASLFTRDKDKVIVGNRVLPQKTLTKLSKDELYDILNFIGIDPGDTGNPVPSDSPQVFDPLNFRK